MRRDKSSTSFNRSSNRNAFREGGGIRGYHSERGMAPKPDPRIFMERAPRNRLERRLAAKALRPEEIAKPEVLYGDRSLAIWKKMDEISQSISENPVTFVVSPTGTGKSTQLPLRLLQEGKPSEMMQPRRIAAEMVSDRMAYHVNEIHTGKGEQLVGCITADVNTVTPETQTIVMTDGVMLHRLARILESDTPPVLLFDEVHEGKRETDVALAVTANAMKTNPNIRVALLSATPNTEVYRSFFNKTLGIEMPSVELEERGHHIEDVEKPDSTMAHEAYTESLNRANVLCIADSVQAIQDVRDEIQMKYRDAGLHAPVIIGVHRNSPRSQIQAVQREYPGGKIIIGTNMLETSITIPDIDTVVDGGLRKEPHINDEDEQSLNVTFASRSSMRQRRGRCGRTKPGKYIHTRQRAQDPFVPFDDEQRLEHSIPEIQRVEIDRTVLMVAAYGLDARKLDFPNSIPKKVIKQAKLYLYEIGALDEAGKITEMGRKINHLPLAPGLGRMVVESEQYSTHTRRQILAIAASMESGGLAHNVSRVPQSWRGLVESDSSDFLAQLELFVAMDGMSHPEQIHHRLDIKNNQDARDLYTKLLKRTGVSHGKPELPTETEVANIERCVLAGMASYLYRYEGQDTYQRVHDKSGTPRELSNRSVVHGRPSLVVGHPYGFDTWESGDLVRKHIIEKAAVVGNPAVLGEVATGMCVWRPDEYALRGGQLIRRERQLYRDKMELGVVRDVVVEDIDDEQAIEFMVQHMLDNPGTAQRQLRDIEKELKDLRKRSRGVPVSIHESIVGIVREAAAASGMNERYADQLIRDRGITIADFIDPSKVEQIRRNSPDHIDRFGGRFTLDYRLGKPRVRNVDLHWAARLPGDVVLDDGREVLFVGEHGKQYSIEELRQLYP